MGEGELQNQQPKYSALVFNVYIKCFQGKKLELLPIPRTPPPSRPPQEVKFALVGSAPNPLINVNHATSRGNA